MSTTATKPVKSKSNGQAITVPLLPKRGRPPKVGASVVERPPLQATREPKPKAQPTAPKAAAPDQRAFLTGAALLKQVSDATRLKIVHLLSRGEMHVGALSEQLGQSQPAVSHHLALLRHGGIIEPRRQGKHNFYGLSDKGRKLAGIVDMIMG